MVSEWQGRITAGLLVATAVMAGMAFLSSGNEPQLAAEAEQPAKQARAPAPMANIGQKPGPAFFIDLTKGFDSDRHYIADYFADSGWATFQWRRENVTFDAKGLTLTVKRETGGKTPYSSGELQVNGHYGYGRYEVIMRASDTPGVVSSFFTYTGPYPDGDPHDEIDFEFVGRQPGQVHLNHFRKGANDPADIDLPFRPSDGEHHYAFEWLPESITWYADGKKLRTVTAENSDVPIPQASGKVIAELWAGTESVKEWTGVPTVERATAVFRCMSHVPVGKTGKQCGDVLAARP